MPDPQRGDPRREQLAELMQARQELAARHSEVAALKSERQALRDELGSARARIAELEGASRAEAEMRKQLSEVHAKATSGMRERITELELKVSQSASLRSRMAELEEEAARLAELELKISDLGDALGRERNASAELKRKLAEQGEQLRTLESRLAAGAPAATNDDLKTIRGIGPKYEKALRALGITTLRQIAEWSEADVATFANKLNLKPERIVRDDWVGRAKKLIESA